MVAANRQTALANDDGKISVGFRVTVTDGVPAKLKVKCSISRTITDKVERTAEAAAQMRLP